MSFLLTNLLCKNIYTMLSFKWSNELFSILKWWLYLYCIFLFSFLIWGVSYSENIKILRRNAEFIIAIGFQTIFCGTYFCDCLIQNCILRIKFLWFRAKITKISSAIIYSATIYDLKNFCPEGKWTSCLQIWLNTRKIPKFQEILNSGEVFWYLVYWIHLLQWLSAVSPIITSNVSRHKEQLGTIGAISNNWIDKTIWYHDLSRTGSGW